MTSSKRIAYLDLARGMGMVLVVMGHVEYMNPTILQSIYVFHMPLFFLLSGILIWEKQEEKKNFIDVLKKKGRTILFPYALFSVLTIGIEAFRLLVKNLDEWDTLFFKVYQTICLQGVSVLWFLPALFISESVFIGIRKRLHTGPLIGCACLLTTVTAILSQYEKVLYEQHIQSTIWRYGHEIWSMLLRNLFCVGFICIGYLLAKYWLGYWNRVWQQILAVGICLLLCVWLLPPCAGSEIRYMSVGSLPLFFSAATAGSLLVISVCRLLAMLPVPIMKKPLAFYGQNSLIVMATHMELRVLYVSINLVTFLKLSGGNNTLLCISIIVLVLLLEVPVIWIFNIFLPRITEFVFQKRTS